MNEEIYREPSPLGEGRTVRGRLCGQSLDLFWNGGELDVQEHCGLQYALEHRAVDFVIRTMEPTP